MVDLTSTARVINLLSWWYGLIETLRQLWRGFEKYLRRYPIPWLPNMLTTARMAVGPFLIIFYYLDLFGLKFVVSTFAIACVTDRIDGWLARLWDCETSYGKKADEIADKIIVICTVGIVAFDWQMTFSELSFLAIIMWRELSIFVARHWLKIGKNIPVSWSAKIKTGIQMLAVGILILRMFVIGQIGVWINWTGTITLIAASMLTIYSGFLYAKSALKNGDPIYLLVVSVVSGAILTVCPFAIWWMYVQTGSFFSLAL
jgi:CDP-diacylglycerol--glycerol-3-phosphate 3-phosphatidyltransferase